MRSRRLIGRSLRSVVDMQALGERTVILDCDVIQADGGTRTAAITGAAVALALALDALVKAGTLKTSPLKQLVAATSVGIVDGAALLDLCYEEDAQAEVDMNVVMTADGGLVETQATAEKGSYSRADLNAPDRSRGSGTQRDLRRAKSSAGKRSEQGLGNREQQAGPLNLSTAHAPPKKIVASRRCADESALGESVNRSCCSAEEGLPCRKRKHPPIATRPCANICSNSCMAATPTPPSTPQSKTFRVALRGKRPKGAEHSPWEVLEHLRIAQWDILDFTRNPNYQHLPWPEGYWPATPAPPDAKAWDKSVRAFRRDLKAMCDLVADPATDLYARIPHGNGQTILREALLVADHNAYHLGELVLLRRLLGAW